MSWLNFCQRRRYKKAKGENLSPGTQPVNLASFAVIKQTDKQFFYINKNPKFFLEKKVETF